MLHVINKKNDLFSVLSAKKKEASPRIKGVYYRH